MQQFKKILIGTTVFFIIIFQQVFAEECPTLTHPEELYEDDKACLAILDERFSSYSLDINFLSDRNYLLSTYPYANQKFVIDTFFVKYCHLTVETRWDLSEDERMERLEAAKKQLYTRVPFPAPIVDSRNLYSKRYLSKIYVASNSLDKFFLPRQFSSDARDQYVLNGNSPGEPETTFDYLRESPFFVTKANKFFVIVSSVKSYDDALKEIRRLKAKAPQFNFVAYAPYKDNPYYGILMATWVRYSVAKEALENAKKFVKSDSYIWSCPNEGDSC